MRKLKFIRQPAVMDRVALKETTFWDQIRKGLFPSPIRISERGVAWPEHLVDEWCKAKAEGRTLRYPPPASSRTSRPAGRR